LEDLIHRIKEGWARADRSGDVYYLDGVALNLHGFYSGLERLFEIISANVDGIRPAGENWHQELLNQMAREIPEVRPALISDLPASSSPPHSHTANNGLTLNIMFVKHNVRRTY